MEEMANRTVSYFYDNFIDGETGKPAFALVRFFKTHPYGELEARLKQIAYNSLANNPQAQTIKCLTLLATAGDKPTWNSRHSSAGHKVIPLVDKSMVEQFPMISQLIQQLGLEIETVLNPDPELIVELQQRQYNVFYIPNALGSKYILAQQDFVIPYQIKSVLGFGGILPSGNLFVVIMFSKTEISPQTANLFKQLALSVKLAASHFDVGIGTVFDS